MSHRLCQWGQEREIGKISFFVSAIDISVSLGDLFEQIAPIDDCSKLSRLNKLFEKA